MITAKFEQHNWTDFDNARMRLQIKDGPLPRFPFCCRRRLKTASISCARGGGGVDHTEVGGVIPAGSHVGQDHHSTDQRIRLLRAHNVSAGVWPPLGIGGTRSGVLQRASLEGSRFHAWDRFGVRLVLRWGTRFV